MGPFWFIPGGRAINACIGSIAGVLTALCPDAESFDAAPLKSACDFAGLMPHRPNTHPPSFPPIPSFELFEGAMERLSLLLAMLDRR
jgi:hypothetical protein